MTDSVDCVGFSGTRDGMTPVQRDRVLDLILEPEPDDGLVVEVRHGLCVGADEEVMLSVAPLLRVILVGHPAFRRGHHLRTKHDSVCDYVLVERSPLVRNRNIVDATDRLVAAPGPNSRGTWYTIRYAESKGKRVDIVYPNGKVEHVAATPPDPEEYA